MLVSKLIISLFKPGYVPKNNASIMILSDPLRSLIVLKASGRAFCNSMKAGCLIKFPPNSIRFPTLCLSSSLASSVRLKFASDFTNILKPNHEHSVLQPLSSQLKPFSSSQPVACVGSENASCLLHFQPLRKANQFSFLAAMNSGSLLSCIRPMDA